MHGWYLAILALLVACPGPRAPRAVTSCPAGQRRLEEAAAQRARGSLFRALARAEEAERTCASEEARRAVASLREALWGPTENVQSPGNAPEAGDAAVVQAAAMLRLAGEPDAALAKLRPIAARLGPDGLAELARTCTANRHAAEARAALEKAAARAERRHGAKGRWQWQQSGFERTVRLAFTPDGARLVSADQTGLVRVWDVAGGHELVAMRARGWPNSLEVSPDGAWIATAQGNGPVEVWEVATGKRVLELPQDAPAVFTPEGHLVMPAKRDGMIEVELPSGKELARFGGSGEPTQIAIARDRIYSNGEDAQRNPVVVAWERGAGHRKLEQRPVPGPIWGLEVTPRGELVVLLRDRILVHDAAGQVRHTFEGAHVAIALAPDGKRLLAGDAGGLKVFELGSGALLRRVEVGPGGISVAAHPRAALAATAADDGLSIWSLADGERTARLGVPNAALAVAFDAEGRRLAVGAASGIATIWDLASGGVSSVTARPGAPVVGVAFGPGGTLATASGPPSSRLLGRQGGQANLNSTLAVWDARGARRWSKELEQLSWIGFRPGTDTLATAAMLPGPQGTWIGLALWDGKGAQTRMITAATHAGFAWSVGGAQVSYASGDGLVVAPVDGGRPAVLDVNAELAAFQPNGNLIAVVSEPGRISLWDAQARQPRRVMLEERGTPVALAWAPDGGALGTAAGTAIRLWDPRTGARLATLAAHAAVTSIAFRPDGRLLAAACDDGLVELWSIADASLVAMLAMPGEASGLVIAPDGAVDGALADGDPLYWLAGAAVLPGRAVWEREAVAGLLPARLAKLPAEATPRAGLPGAAPPPQPLACIADPGEQAHHVWLGSASAPDDRTVSLCVGVTAYGDDRPQLPACFVVELASGAYRPRAPTPREALGQREPAAITTAIEGAKVTLCRAGACRELAIPELPTGDDASPQVVVSDDGALVAAISDPGEPGTGRRAKHAVIYDAATGRRLRRLELDADEIELAFLGGALLVTRTPCAGPCSTSRLVEPRTGRRLGTIGGAQPLNTSELSAAQVTGDVWAFNDWDTPTVVYQDVKTGRVVRRFERPPTCPADSSDDCQVHMIHAGGGLAILGAASGAGSVTLVDARGKVVAQHRAPACKP
jgi:WD40 repeat protein